MDHFGGISFLLILFGSQPVRRNFARYLGNLILSARFKRPLLHVSSYQLSLPLRGQGARISEVALFSDTELSCQSWSQSCTIFLLWVLLSNCFTVLFASLLFSSKWDGFAILWLYSKSCGWNGFGERPFGGIIVPFSAASLHRGTYAWWAEARHHLGLRWHPGAMVPHEAQQGPQGFVRVVVCVTPHVEPIFCGGCCGRRFWLWGVCFSCWFR